MTFQVDFEFTGPYENPDTLEKEYTNLLWFGVIGSEKFNEDIEAPIRKYNNA